MNPLESRKQLLIAESELNRAQLVQEWQAMGDGVRSIADRAKTVSSIASTAASLIAGLASFRRKKSAPTAKKTSWLQTVLKGAGLISTVWQMFRPPARDRDGI
ncbi:MAG: hypothetical protein ABSF60_08015 [Verrucomicrobiota bacterium]